MNKVAFISAYAAPSIEQEERPRKKLTRPAASLNTITVLNDCGIAAYLIGNYEEAEKCFSQALCRVDVRFLCASIQSSLDIFSKKQETSAWKQVDCPDTQKAVRSIDLKVEDYNINSDSKSQTFLYIYQRHEYDEGMEVHNTPLALQETSIPDSVSWTLFYNIGVTFVRRGQYETSLTWFGRALSLIETSNFSPTKLQLQILQNLGYCCYRVGKNAESLEHFRKTLMLSVQTGAGETAVAAALNCLGLLHFHRHANDAEKAMGLLKQSLVLYRKCHGSLTKEVATVLNNIGRVCYLCSKYEQALQMYGEAMRIRILLLGEDSLDVAASVFNTGQTYHQLGQLNQAMKHYERFLGLAEARLGTESRDVAIVYRCMGEIHQEQGDTKKALGVFQDALKSGRASLGNSHPEVATTLNKLGNLCYEMHDHDSALKYYKEGLGVEQRVLAPDHSHIIITLTNIAHIYKHRADYAGALRTYRKVHKLKLKTYGANSIEVAVTHSSIGLMQYHLKSFEAAFGSYQEALSVRRAVYGSDDHADVASTLNSIGLVLFKQDMFDMANQCFSESLRIRKKLLGPNHRDVAILWYNIATIYFETGQEEVAIQLYKETLRVERANLGSDHPDVVLTLQHIAQVLQQVGDLDGSLGYFLEALAIERRKRSDSASVAKILNLIGNIHLQQGKVAEMMKCFVESSRIFESHPSGETLVIAGYNFYGLSKTHPVCATVA